MLAFQWCPDIRSTSYISKFYLMFHLDTVGEVTITSTTGQISSGGGRVTVTTGTTTRGASTFGAVVVATRTTAWCWFVGGFVGRTFGSSVRVAGIVAVLLYRGLVWVRVVTGTTRTMSARSRAAQIQARSLRIFSKIYLQNMLPFF